MALVVQPDTHRLTHAKLAALCRHAGQSHQSFSSCCHVLEKPLDLSDPRWFFSIAGLMNWSNVEAMSWEWETTKVVGPGVIVVTFHSAVLPCLSYAENHGIFLFFDSRVSLLA